MNARDTLEKARRLEPAWYDATTLRRRVPEINSRARRMGAQGQITADDLGDKLADAHGSCSSCGKDFGLRFGDKWTICFRVPLSRGGECSRANIDLGDKLADAHGSCSSCGKDFGLRFGDKWTICFRVPLSRGGECSRANIDL